MLPSHTLSASNLPVGLRFWPANPSLTFFWPVLRQLRSFQQIGRKMPHAPVNAEFVNHGNAPTICNDYSASMGYVGLFGLTGRTPHALHGGAAPFAPNCMAQGPSMSDTLPSVSDTALALLRTGIKANNVTSTQFDMFNNVACTQFDKLTYSPPEDFIDGLLSGEFSCHDACLDDLSAIVWVIAHVQSDISWER